MESKEVTKAIKAISKGIDKKSNPSEDDIQNIFIENKFFRSLGSGGFSEDDLKSEFTLPNKKRPDFIAEDNYGSPHIVYEFKEPSEDLSKHTQQIKGYTERLNPKYGVLTNGKELWVFSPENFDSPRAKIDLDKIDEEAVRKLKTYLEIPEYNIENVTQVKEFIQGLNEIGLNDELGEDYFFESFSLEDGSVFTELVLKLRKLLQELRDEKEEKFVKGAYEYWESAYLQEPEDTPSSWKKYIDSDQDKRDFMYALETAHALLGRLLLAKACEDQEVFSNLAFEEIFSESLLSRYSEEINIENYPITALKFFFEMNDKLVEGLFEDDIFIWWTDAFGDRISEGPSEVDPLKRYSGPETGKASRETREEFSKAVANVMLSLLKFDFSKIQGDPLGNLYQRYFDPETRKALGEFYTPKEVVNLMVDRAEYKKGISNERLIDPACGSGTFLVEAAERYLKDVERFNDEPDWEKQIRDLCTHPHIVGLDIHPFAVLMAQIRFMVAILPKYKLAKRQNPNFTISRLPIYRTDSLVDETEELTADLGSSGERQMRMDAITKERGDLMIPVKVPVEAKDDDLADEEGFLQPRIRLPKWDNIQTSTKINNEGDYFAALQAILDVSKDHVKREEWEYSRGLDREIQEYVNKDLKNIEFFEDYVNDILSTVKMLKKEYGDGRLFKMFEDSILSLVLKNYISYEYVVANPPYVRIQNLTEWRKNYLDRIYKETSTDNYDIYCSFYQKGVELLTENGSLTYIAPNLFMVTNYGQGLRKYLLDNTLIQETIDFRDSGVFEDATTYPLILKAKKEEKEEKRNKNQIKGLRIKANIDEDSRKELDRKVVERIEEKINSDSYSDEILDVFQFKQRDLDNGYWSICPPEEFSIMNKMEEVADKNIGEITSSVFQGIRTSANKDVYVVEVHDVDRVEASDKGGKVTVTPLKENRKYEIEKDTLRPFLQGKDVKRWQVDWRGLHVIYPYNLSTEGGEDTAELISKEEMKKELPKTWEFFEKHESTLRGREDGKWQDSDRWWEYGRSQNLAKFEQPKIIQGEISSDAKFMVDNVGTWYFTTAYGVLPSKKYRKFTDGITAQLNSKLLDFYLKHIAAQKQGGHYSYRTQYVEKLPCVIWGAADELRDLGSEVEEILEIKHTKSRISRFPKAYLEDFNGELEKIKYEWQTDRRPVNPKAEEENGIYKVKAGRTDEISDPSMNSEERMEYVKKAVEGLNVSSGQTTEIPIPRSESGVRNLLDKLEEDKNEQEKSEISDYEAKINQTVYDLFELSEQEKQIVENFSQIF